MGRMRAKHRIECDFDARCTEAINASKQRA
jgi:hypothetical protein